MGAGEVTLATESLGVLLLALAVLAETADGNRAQLGGRRGVGIVHSGLVARDTHGLGAAVARESTALADRLSGEGVIGDGARRLFDGLLSPGIVGDLGAASAVGKRSALEIHGLSNGGVVYNDLVVCLEPLWC